MKNKSTYWITLRNVSWPQKIECQEWCIERNINFDLNQSLAKDGIYRHASYSFTNDLDAMLFKLTFSNYL
jgi:hypothetical protein